VLQTESGHKIKGTANHPQLVLRNNEHIWVKLGDLRVGDLVCFNPVQALREDHLKLNLSKQLDTVSIDSDLGKKKKKLLQPTEMSEDLAYFIGALISEGSYSKYRTEITNSNIKYLTRLSDCLYSVFGLDSNVKRVAAAGTEYRIGNNVGTSNKDCTSLIYCSVALSAWWDELGLLSSEKYGRKSSYFKEIPWSILQADKQSQLAFIAAYIEGDGQIYKDRHCISIWSKSDKLREQFQILLNAHGVMTYNKRDCLTTASAFDAFKLFWLIKPYLSHKKYKVFKNRSTKVKPEILWFKVVA
jgi:intein/homing endonuclease